MGQVNGRGRFSTLHSSETPRPIFMKLEIYNYFPDTTLHAKLQGPTSTWVVWANSQFDAFLSFFSFLRHAHRSHFWTHPNAQYVIMRRSHQGSAFWGLERLNLKFDPFIPPPKKNVKIGTLSWRSMENCSRPNSGTVSHIMFKLGTRIDHPSGITWHDSKVKTQGHNVT